MKAIKVDFSKLIGHHYSLENKMNILDWMLKTGRGFNYRSGWDVDGINKSLLSYSANNYDVPACLPKDKDYDLFFDAVFARAVYSKAYHSLKEWRLKESIYPNKYRMLKFNDDIPKRELGRLDLNSLIGNIFKLDGKLHKKEFHHQEYKNRTEPKILWISIYTIGNGWIIQYEFSFKEFDYEPGWTNGFYQSKDESIWQFLQRGYDNMLNLIKQ